MASEDKIVKLLSALFRANALDSDSSVFGAALLASLAFEVL